MEIRGELVWWLWEWKGGNKMKVTTDDQATKLTMGSNYFKTGNYILGTECSWATAKNVGNLKNLFKRWVLRLEREKVWQGRGMAGCQRIFKRKCWPLRKLKKSLCVSCVDQSLEGSTALEKENAIACVTFTPVARIHQHFGRCSAVSLTLFPTRMNSTTGFQFLIQVRSYESIFQI